MKRYLLYRAGKAVIDQIRDEGLRPEKVRIFAAPAGGPKWFVCVGFDNVLIKTGFLQKGTNRVLLVGSSAGAWRCLAMACKEPLTAYEKLRIAYSRNTFTALDTPSTVSAALRGNVDSFIGEEDVSHILSHRAHDVAVHTIRAKGPAASESRGMEGAAIIAVGVMNALSSHAMRLFFERVVFFTGADEPDFLNSSFEGSGVRLTSENLRPAALATGSLPYVVSGVKDIPDAPRGVYRDGGLMDYQLNQDYHPGAGMMTLFFHYQERIISNWFDKVLLWRKPPKNSLDRVLQVYPGPAFVDLLPDKRLPDRNDFVIFVDKPDERIRRWDVVSEISSVLGEQFMDDVESGRISDLVRPL